MAQNKFAAAIAAAAEQDDYNEAAAGGDFTPLPEGPARARFVGYIELGQHKGEWKGKEKLNDKARFVFEVSGPKIEPRDDGLPHLLSFDLNKPERLTEKSKFFQVFRKMNYADKYKVFAEMLGEAFRVEIIHRVVGEGADKRTFVGIQDSDGNYHIAGPSYDDPESGERKTVRVAEAVSPLRCFLWNFPDNDQWESIFIDGEWEAKDGKPAQSKNKHQIKIKDAVNWIGSPMQEALLGDLDVGDIGDKVDTTGSDAGVDPLADDDIPF